jgi:hypothetical protein
MIADEKEYAEGLEQRQIEEEMDATCTEDANESMLLRVNPSLTDGDDGGSTGSHINHALHTAASVQNHCALNTLWPAIVQLTEGRSRRLRREGNHR